MNRQTPEPTISRRGFFGGAAAMGSAVLALGLGAAGRPLAADDPAGDDAAPSPSRRLLDTRPVHYPFRVGEFEAAVLSDGTGNLAPVAGRVVTNASDDETAALLSERFLPTDHIRPAYNTTVLRAGGRTILFDTGNGRGRGGDIGRQLDALRGVGLSPADIDLIVITHAHPDHLWGLADDAGAPTYPNAEVRLHEREFAFWSNDANANDATRAVFDGFAARIAAVGDRVATFGDDAEIVAGVNIVPAFGHTPGHCAIHLESAGERLLLTADSANHHVLFLARPDFNFGFDLDKPMAVAARRHVFGMAAADAIPVLGYHFPFPGIGHITAEGDGFRFHPRPWEMG